MRYSHPTQSVFSHFRTHHQEIVVVDASLENYSQLIGLLPAGCVVRVLQQTTEMLSQLADIVAEYPDLDVLHLISHGAPGAILLGEQTLCLDTLPRHAATLARLREYMAAEGE